ncbi:MAG TPA: hypothetical protein VMW24_09965 [Sedimentisphaerales bacterium]|nr:hypothetical protein [Sedimentisphaerales bacterium]
MVDQPEETKVDTPMKVGADLKEFCFQCREEIQVITARIQRLRDDKVDMPGDIGANITLAYRHLEDARMRLGKAVQALDGGTSCYTR